MTDGRNDTARTLSLALNKARVVLRPEDYERSIDIGFSGCPSNGSTVGPVF